MLSPLGLGEVICLARGPYLGGVTLYTVLYMKHIWDSSYVTLLSM